MIELLAERAKLVGIDLTEEQVESLTTYLQELSAFNEHTNLVSRAEAEIVIDNHILDSLTLVPVLRSLGSGSDASLIDIGSGAGFPGLILAAVCPFLQVTLVESIGKKCHFLSLCAEAMGLDSRVAVLNERAEELGHARGMRESFDFATARAVGTVELISEFCLPFLRVGGYFLSQKSRAQLDGELDSARTAITVLGGQVEKVVDVDNKATGKDFAVVLVKKCKATPGKYPRSFGQMKKGGAR